MYICNCFGILVSSVYLYIWFVSKCLCCIRPDTYFVLSNKMWMKLIKIGTVKRNTYTIKNTTFKTDETGHKQYN